MTIDLNVHNTLRHISTLAQSVLVDISDDWRIKRENALIEIRDEVVGLLGMIEEATPSPVSKIIMQEYRTWHDKFKKQVPIPNPLERLVEQGRAEWVNEEEEIDLDTISLILNDLRKRGFQYPHVIIFADGSGRVSKDYVGKEDNLLFSFHRITEIASEYIRWQADWRN